MKATFESVKKINFKPIDSNESVLLDNFSKISENRLAIVKDEKYGDISLTVSEPRTLNVEDNLANKIINMNFPSAIRDMIDSHTITTMKDGSYIDCLVVTETESEDTTVPGIEYTETGNTNSEGLKEFKCTCGMLLYADAVENITHSAEEHETYYTEHKNDSVEPPVENTENTNSDTPSTNENGTVSEGYYVDPSAPNGYRKCRPGHIHGATYMHPICCIHGDHMESLMKRTVLVRLVSETLGEIVLYSLVGIDDIRINTQIYKVLATADMTINDVNKDSLFYPCFTI